MSFKYQLGLFSATLLTQQVEEHIDSIKKFICEESLVLRDLVCDRIRDGIHRVDAESQNEGFNCSYPYKGGPSKSWKTINENR